MFWIGVFYIKDFKSLHGNKSSGLISGDLGGQFIDSGDFDLEIS